MDAAGRHAAEQLVTFELHHTARDQRNHPDAHQLVNRRTNVREEPLVPRLEVGGGPLRSIVPCALTNRRHGGATPPPASPVVRNGNRRAAPTTSVSMVTAGGVHPSGHRWTGRFVHSA